MAFVKGHPRYGGRPPGGKNKKTIEAKEIAKEMGVDPFRILLMFAADDYKGLGYDRPLSPDTRMQAAKEACTYIYPKQKSIEVKIED